MTHTDAAESIALRVQREMAATPEEVFDAYTNPEKQRIWLTALGPDEGEVQTTVNLRVGGVWETTFRPTPETLAHDRQTYVEIDRPWRLVTELVAESSGAQPMPATRMRIALDFEPSESGTLVTVEHSGFPAAAMRDFFQTVVWPASLERVAAFVGGERA